MFLSKQYVKYAAKIVCINEFLLLCSKAAFFSVNAIVFFFFFFFFFLQIYQKNLAYFEWNPILSILTLKVFCY